MIKIKDITNILGTGVIGIFQQIKNDNTFTWLSTADATNLDLEYYLNHSGEKYLSPLTFNLYQNNENTYLSKISSIIKTKYKDKWDKLYDAFINSDYNPLENYSMVEDENVKTEIVNETDGNNNIFGFNTTSVDGVEQTKSGAKSTTTGDFDKNHRKLTRSGNIGVATSQQMLESEINLRKYNFYLALMNDVDEIMTISFRRVV